MSEELSLRTELEHLVALVSAAQAVSHPDVARAAGMRPFQEEGLLLVAKGLTSLAELQRVLKE